MSLRRSARNISKTEPVRTETEASNSVANGDTKKPATATKKRKSKASGATSTQDALNTDEATSLISTTKAPDAQFSIPNLPATPLSKRRKPVPDSPSVPPPFTPTPSGVGLMKAPLYGHPMENLAEDPVRPAEPHATNAPLSTPGGSKLVAYASSPVQQSISSQGNSQSPNKRKAKEAVPPDVGALRPPTSTTDTLLKDACAHLCSVDPRMKILTEKHHCKIFSPEGLREVVDPFTALASGIIGQQVCYTSPPPCTLMHAPVHWSWIARGYIEGAPVS
jgi:DNA-3-methyladenine glycosylase II